MKSRMLYSKAIKELRIKSKDDPRSMTDADAVAGDMREITQSLSEKEKKEAKAETTGLAKKEKNFPLLGEPILDPTTLRPGEMQVLERLWRKLPPFSAWHNDGRSLVQNQSEQYRIIENLRNLGLVNKSARETRLTVYGRKWVKACRLIAGQEAFPQPKVKKT